MSSATPVSSCAARLAIQGWNARHSLRHVAVGQRRRQRLDDIRHRVHELRAWARFRAIRIRRRSTRRRARARRCHRVALRKHETLDRHRVQHFVGEHDAAHRRAPASGLTTAPAPRARAAAVAMRARWRSARSALTSRMRVALRQAYRCAASSVSTSAAMRPEPAPSSSTSPPVTRNTSAHCRARQRENRLRHLRRGHEVPAAAELGGAGAVVPEPRCVQREPHAGIEADDAAVLAHESADVLDHALRMRALVGVQRAAGL